MFNLGIASGAQVGLKLRLILFVLFPARRENLDHLGSLATVREMVMFNGKQRSTITTIRKYK